MHIHAPILNQSNNISGSQFTQSKISRKMHLNYFCVTLIQTICPLNTIFHTKDSTFDLNKLYEFQHNLRIFKEMTMHTVRMRNVDIKIVRHSKYWQLLRNIFFFFFFFLHSHKNRIPEIHSLTLKFWLINL